MSPSFGTKIKMTRKYVGELRKSKVASTAGCGSLVEFPGFSGIMGGQNLWDTNFNDDMKIHEKSLEDFLQKDFFIQASSEKKYGEYKRTYQIPTIRFPDYYYCPRCHELDRYKNISKSDKKDSVHPLSCINCGKDTKLIPSRFVLACEDGHIEDFPYVWWVHKDKKCSNPKLRLEYMGKTGGLESTVVSCETCGAHNTMQSCLNQKAMEGLKCRGRRPWLGANSDCDCNKDVRTLLRGANNIYYPETISSLTIPPWSSAAQEHINKHLEAIKERYEEEEKEDAEYLIGKWFKKNDLEKRLDMTKEEFFDQVELRMQTRKLTPLEMQYNEYKAFTGKEKDEPNFKTEETNVPNEYKNHIACVKIVRRLREVQVLRGFRRIDAFGENGGQIAPISKRKEKWLPAVEMLGEGIFIEFQMNALRNWKESLEPRYVKLRERYNNKRMAASKGSFSPIYVMMHTFSHLLMRELSYQSGYDVSSIKEKIYYSEEDGKQMAGVLIYTSSTSSDGGLGGLARQGLGFKLEQSIHSLLEKAQWCSNDPICIEAKEQGVNSMNYAACYACTYVPEISCGDNNMLLDRYSIVGNLDEPTMGYFGRKW